MENELNNIKSKNINQNNISSISEGSNKILTELEMQELVSDYLFGTLTTYEKVVFEANIGKYPSIQQEIKEFRTAFEEVDKFTFEEDLLNRSRNLSYKVQKRLDEQKRPRGIFTTLKFLTPAISLLLIIIIAKYFVSNETLDETMAYLNLKDYNTVENFNLSNESKLKTTPVNILKESDIAILENEISQQELEEYSLSFDNSLDLVDNSIIQYTNDFSNNDDIAMIEFAEISSGSYSLINFNNTIAELGEEDLQFLLNSKY